MSDKLSIKKETYGDYKTNNYGVHSQKITIGKLRLYFSYDTVIAFEDGYLDIVVSENKWKQTTGRHLNWIEPDKSKRINREKFENKLNELLSKYNLSV